MPIYKYYEPDSLSFILNEIGVSLRYSQPEILNDPFELQPTLKTMVDQYREKIDSDLSECDQEIILKKYQNGMKEFYSNALNKTKGILSLTKNGYSRPMWAYYSKNHTGYIIEFNSEDRIPVSITFDIERPKSTISGSYFNTHGIFKPISTYQKIPKVTPLYEKDEYNTENDSYILDGVTFHNAIYTTNRTNSPSDEIYEYYYKKDKQWEHEQEIRAVKEISLDECTYSVLNGYPIFTKILDSKHVKSIILGVRSSPELEQDIRLWVNKYAKDVIIKKARLCDSKFKLIYDEI